MMSLDLNKPVVDVEPDPAEYVGFWPRFGARAIDTALHWFIALPAGFAGGILFLIVQHRTGRSVNDSIQLLRDSHFLGIAFSFLGIVSYGSMVEWLHGSTLGKRLFGIVVLRETKKPCGFFAAIGRELAFFIDSLLFGLVGAYAMSGNRREQRYGDLWCKTVVVRRRSAPQSALRSDLRFIVVLFFGIGIDGLFLLFPSVLVAAS